MNDGKESLHEYTKSVVETDEKNPVIIAGVTARIVESANSYRVRLTPVKKD